MGIAIIGTTEAHFEVSLATDIVTVSDIIGLDKLICAKEKSTIAIHISVDMSNYWHMGNAYWLCYNSPIRLRH